MRSYLLTQSTTAHLHACHSADAMRKSRTVGAGKLTLHSSEICLVQMGQRSLSAVYDLEFSGAWWNLRLTIS